MTPLALMLDRQESSSVANMVQLVPEKKPANTVKKVCDFPVPAGKVANLLYSIGWLYIVVSLEKLYEKLKNILKFQNSLFYLKQLVPCPFQGPLGLNSSCVLVNTYIDCCHFHVHGELNATFSSLAGNSSWVIYFTNFASYIWKRIF